MLVREIVSVSDVVSIVILSLAYVVIVKVPLCAELGLVAVTFTLMACYSTAAIKLLKFTVLPEIAQVTDEPDNGASPSRTPHEFAVRLAKSFGKDIKNFPPASIPE